MAKREERINLVIAAQNRTSAELKKIVKDFGAVEKKTGKVIHAQKRFGKAFKNAGTEASDAITGLTAQAGALGRVLGAFGPAGISAAASMVAMGVAVHKGTMSAAEWNKRLMRTEALLKATGGAAGLTTRELDELAKSADLSTLGDRNEVMDAINVLQTFKSIQGETFKDTISIAQDMSATFGQSLKSSVTMLGKALEDPIAGLNAMKRVGVSFTAQEREMIQTMVRANDVAGAQGKILEVLHNQVGGAAGAEAGGLLGSIDTLNYRMREFTESLEETDTYKGSVDALAESFRNLTWTVKDLRNAFTLDEELAQLEAAIKNKENLISEIETEGVDFLGFKGWALEGHREELSEMQRQLAELEAQIEKRNREEQKHIKTSTSSDSSGDSPDPAAVAKAASSLSKLNTEIARMTMTDREFDEFQLEQRVERLGKVLGKTNPKLREFRRLAQERIDAKYAPKQPAPGMDDHPFSARKDAENAAFAEALARHKKELTAFDREYTRVTQGETALAEEAARAQAEAWERAGADRLQVQEWLSAKLEGVEEQRLAASREAADGMTRALDAYIDEASNAAAQTEQIFGGGLRSLEDQLVNVCTTGKFAWRDMVTSWAADLSRMMIQQSITGPLAKGLSGAIGGMFGGGGTQTDFSGLRDAGLTGYANGGVSTSPQLAWVSEGRYPMEAHVPLPDGRAIPVNITTPRAPAAPAQPQQLKIEVINESGKEMRVARTQQVQDTPHRTIARIWMEAVEMNTEGLGEFTGRY